MAVTVVLNGVSYEIPDTGDNGWGQGLTDYFVAQASGLLQKSGGTFSLTAEVDFGATYGLKSAYFKSRAVAIASAGQVRLGNAESIKWRNAANSADLALLVNASNLLEFNGTALQPAGSYISSLTGDVTATGPGAATATIAAGAIDNAKVSNAAAIAYSKLNLSASVVNADISPSAAIAYTKLALTGSVVFADLAAALQTIINGKVDKSTLTTKGDLFVATASATIARQGIGSDGQVLTADSAQTNGLKWANLGASTAPLITKFTATGTTTGYLFTVTAANATVGATYTNNGNTYTVLATIAGATQLFCSQAAAPLASGTLTKATGTGDATITFSANRAIATFTKTGSPLYIRVRMVGGGGGGGGSGTTTGTAATDGVATVFGAALLSAGGGLKGSRANNGGVGGSSSVTSPASGTALQGGSGGGAPRQGTSPTSQSPGGDGGNSAFGGGGSGGSPGNADAGQAGAANTGGGGGGADVTSTSSTEGGSGGGAGGFVDAIVPSPSASYPYAVGTGGSGQLAGASGSAGGAGGSGYIEVTEYYQ